MLVSQFTLFGDARKGRRPSFVTAAKEPLASGLYERTGRELENAGLAVAYGEFGADMAVELVNDGPVTILSTPSACFKASRPYNTWSAIRSTRSTRSDSISRPSTSKPLVTRP